MNLKKVLSCEENVASDMPTLCQNHSISTETGFFHCSSQCSHQPATFMKMNQTLHFDDGINSIYKNSVCLVLQTHTQLAIQLSINFHP